MSQREELQDRLALERGRSEVLDDRDWRRFQTVSLIVVNNWPTRAIAAVMRLSPGAASDAVAGRYGYRGAHDFVYAEFEAGGFPRIVRNYYDPDLWNSVAAAASTDDQPRFIETLEELRAMTDKQLARWCEENANMRRRGGKGRKYAAHEKRVMIAAILDNEYCKRLDAGVDGEGPRIQRPAAERTIAFPDWLLAIAFGCSETMVGVMRRGDGEYGAIHAEAHAIGADLFTGRYLTWRMRERLRETCLHETGVAMPIRLKGRLPSKR